MRKLSNNVNANIMVNALATLLLFTASTLVFAKQSESKLTTKKSEAVQMKKVVLFCGYAGVGKRTLIDAVRKQMPNTAKFEKDVLSDAIMGGLDHTSSEYNAIKDRIYGALIAVGLDNLNNDNTVAIMQAYWGDKLTKAPTVDMLKSAEYEVKIIYLHCSGAKQNERIKTRNAARDHDKVGEKFNPYRLQHVKNHLRELGQVSEFLLLDVEDDASLQANVERTIAFINAPSDAIAITPLKDPAMLDAVTLEEALGGAEEFKALLDRVKSGNALTAQTVTPMYELSIKKAVHEISPDLPGNDQFPHPQFGLT